MLAPSPGTHRHPPLSYQARHQIRVLWDCTSQIPLLFFSPDCQGVRLPSDLFAHLLPSCCFWADGGRGCQGRLKHPVISLKDKKLLPSTGDRLPLTSDSSVPLIFFRTEFHLCHGFSMTPKVCNLRHFPSANVVESKLFGQNHHQKDCRKNSARKHKQHQCPCTGEDPSRQQQEVPSHSRASGVFRQRKNETGQGCERKRGGRERSTEEEGSSFLSQRETETIHRPLRASTLVLTGTQGRQAQLGDTNAETLSVGKPSLFWVQKSFPRVWGG